MTIDTIYSTCRLHIMGRSLACNCVWAAKPSTDKRSILRRLSGTPKEPDAYAVMGLEPDVKGADVKRRYMRLSLLIHPDKCSHPQAQHAFQAVSKASKELQACPALHLICMLLTFLRTLYFCLFDCHQ